ncbi:MAG: hypothetical protein QXJ06_04170 [Candidatus Aenigmatarchaeota archaeon]
MKIEIPTENVIFLILAAVFNFFVIFYLRKYGFSLNSFLMLSPVVLLNQFLFVYAYTNPKGSFLLTWFLGTTITNSFSVLMGLLVFREMLTIKKIIAIFLILAGIVFLKF